MFAFSFSLRFFVALHLTPKAIIAELSSGRLKILQAEPHNYRNRTTCMHRNRNPCNSFFMVNMASSVDHGRVRPTTTTSRNITYGGHIPANRPTEACSLGL